MLHEQTVRSLTGIVGNPCSALEMVNADIADYRACAERTLEALADLIGGFVVVIAFVIESCHRETLENEAACRGLDSTLAVGGAVVGIGTEIKGGVPHSGTDEASVGSRDCQTAGDCVSSGRDVDCLARVGVDDSLERTVGRVVHHLLAFDLAELYGSRDFLQFHEIDSAGKSGAILADQTERLSGLDGAGEEDVHLVEAHTGELRVRGSVVGILIL